MVLTHWIKLHVHTICQCTNSTVTRARWRSRAFRFSTCRKCRAIPNRQSCSTGTIPDRKRTKIYSRNGSWEDPSQGIGLCKADGGKRITLPSSCVFLWESKPRGSTPAQEGGVQAHGGCDQYQRWRNLNRQSVATAAHPIVPDESVCAPANFPQLCVGCGLLLTLRQSTAGGCFRGAFVWWLVTQCDNGKLRTPRLSGTRTKDGFKFAASI